MSCACFQGQEALVVGANVGERHVLGVGRLPSRRPVLRSKASAVFFVPPVLATFWEKVVR